MKAPADRGQSATHSYSFPLPALSITEVQPPVSPLDPSSNFGNWLSENIMSFCISQAPQLTVSISLCFERCSVSERICLKGTVPMCVCVYA